MTSLIISFLRLIDEHIIIILAVTLIFYVIISTSLYFIYGKVSINKKKGLIPFVNIISLLDIVSLPKWMALLIFIPYINFIGIFIMCLLIGWRMGKVFNQSKPFRIGLSIFPFIFMPLLAKKDLVYTQYSESEKIIKEKIIVVENNDIVLDIPTYEVEVKDVGNAFVLSDYIDQEMYRLNVTVNSQTKVENISALDDNKLYDKSFEKKNHLEGETEMNQNPYVNDMQSVSVPTVSETSSSVGSNVASNIPTPVVQSQVHETTQSVQPIDSGYTFDYNQLYNIKSEPVVQTPEPIVQTPEPIVQTPELVVPQQNPVSEVAIINKEDEVQVTNDNVQTTTIESVPIISNPVVPEVPLVVPESSVAPIPEIVPVPEVSILSSQESFNTLQMAAPPSFETADEKEKPEEKVQEQSIIPEVSKEELVSIQIDEPDTLPVGNSVKESITNEPDYNDIIVQRQSDQMFTGSVIPAEPTVVAQNTLDSASQMNPFVSNTMGVDTPLMNVPTNNAPILENTSLLRENTDDRYAASARQGPIGSRFIDNDENKYTLPKEEPIQVQQPTDPNLLSNPMSIFGTTQGVLRPTAGEALKIEEPTQVQPIRKEAITACPNCGFIVKEGQTSCVVCGYRFE